MKKLIILFVAIFATTLASAQSFNVGTSVLQAGIGLGSNLGGLGKGRPALSVSYEYGKWAVGGPGVISLGGYLGNTGYKYSGSGYTQKWDYTIIGLRSAYHYNGFTDVPQLDVYGGAMLAYNNVSYKATGFTGVNAYGSGIDLSLFVGGRWFFNEQFGAFAELGYGVSTLNLGVSYRF